MNEIITKSCVKMWENRTKRVYNTFKRMPKDKLVFLGKFAGLDTEHYKNKSMLSKALTSKLSWSVLPQCMKDWK